MSEEYKFDSAEDSRRVDQSSASEEAGRATVGRVNRRAYSPASLEPKTWWTTSRRNVIIGGAAAGGVLLVGGGIYLAVRDDTEEVDQDSLALQQSQGWDIGSEGAALQFPGDTTMLDSRGGTAWQEYLEPARMLSAYGTKSDAWMPFFVPTLMQSLQFDSLRAQLRPVSTFDMTEAYGRGQAIARDFLRNAANAHETAIIADLPGRDAVAFGAGLADTARLVPVFDNFPHPLGVTPSHETLGALLYYAAEIDAKQSALEQNAAPVFLLDSNRLNNYADADTQFDNRYLAKVPTAENLKERGIKNVLYVTPDRTRTEELDDLNEDFVAYKNNNVNVAMLPLADFTPGEQAVAGTTNNSNRGYYYGGHPMFIPIFFSSYPFYGARAGYGYGGNYSRPATGMRNPPAVPPRYTPAPRPTLFSSSRIGGAAVAGGVGRSKPTGFGRATVRVASSGRVVGTRAGRSGAYSSGRSGSLGRGGSSVGG